MSLPNYSQFQPDQVVPTINQHLADNRRAITELLADLKQPTWQNLMEPLADWDDQLERAWSPISHLNSVKNNPALRDAYSACLPLLSDYAAEMGQNADLFAAIQQLADQSADLDRGQRKVIANNLRDFKLSGISLPAEQQARYKAIVQQLSALTSQFSDNVLDVTNAWHKTLDQVDALAGLPDSAIALAAQTAEQRGVSGWVLTLDYPSYQPVMTYAEDRTLREALYTAYQTRASDQGPHDVAQDNTQLIEDILALRHEKAQLLGFDQYVDYSLATKMASSADEVSTFLYELADRCKPQAQQEMVELQQFAAELDGLHRLEAWDIAYYAEKLRKQRYDLSEEDLKPYFPVGQVIQGLFDVVERLYSLKIQAVEGVDVWHSDVTFYEIRTADGVCAQFYLDLYARPHKRGGAWMDTCQSRMCSSQRNQLPVAYMTCNFTPAVVGQPSLLTHTEVETLFHEFGHGLHHMLTQIDYPQIAGINGVAWDAVELPSQFMENFCWQRESLDLIARHYKTGEPLPEALFERMLAAKNFQSAMGMLRQIEFSLFDLQIHQAYDPATGGQITETLAAIREQVAVVQPPAWQRFPQSFLHIFAGGYAAGYYSYLWAQVLSADAFALFEEQGIFDPAVGQAFLRHILQAGGSKDAADLFMDFRGRAPTVDALLRHNGIG
jgi:oligopeptidase A